MGRENHGMTSSPEYRSWQKMKERCTNPKSNRYHRYGGRGISVCHSWINSFSSFYEDIGEKPFVGAQIDRKDNNGDYNKDNCRWISPTANSQNISTTKATKEIALKIRELHSSGKRQCELCVMFGLSKYIVSRIVLRKTWVNV